MKYIFCALLFVTTSVADTININWVSDYETYAQTTCEIGGDIILPTTPTKRGYTFKGWTPYTRLEYIESTGTQYIDTNLLLDSTNLRIIANFIPTSSLGNSVNILFGTVQQSNVDIFVFNNNMLYSGGNNSGVYTHRETLINKEIVLEDIFSINSPRRHMYGTIDGKAFSIQTDSEPITTNQGAQARILGHTDIYRSKMKLKHLSVYKSGQLSLNLIPIRRKSDGEVGMYDTVSQTFFTNAGTGSFVAGPVAENQNFYE